MKILLVGGGSGGHITPLIAIAEELKSKHPKSEVVIISERMGVFNHLFDVVEEKVDKVIYINAGKYRRYHGESWYRKIIDVRTMLLNIRDVFKLMLGTIESFFLLLKIRPNVVFIKGGYVGVPVGLASRLLRIPYVTHDSDAVPGLTNRIIAKKARINAVGMPLDNYRYPKDKMIYVGIPVTEDFLRPADAARSSKRKDLELKSSDFLIFITGGSNGAQRMDKIVHDSLHKLLEAEPKLNIAHQVGKGNEEIYSDYPFHLHSRIRVAGFFRPISAYIDAADLVIARAGATSIAEVALRKKPLVIIPNPYLSGGHQLKNADVYAKSKAALVLNEHQAMKDPGLLGDIVQQIMESREGREEMAGKLYAMTPKDSAKKIARLLTDIAKKKVLKN